MSTQQLSSGQSAASLAVELEVLYGRRTMLQAQLEESSAGVEEVTADFISGADGITTEKVTRAKGRRDVLQEAISVLDSQIGTLEHELAATHQQEQYAARLKQARELVASASASWEKYLESWSTGTAAIQEAATAVLAAATAHNNLRLQLVSLAGGDHSVPQLLSDLQVKVPDANTAAIRCNPALFMNRPFDVGWDLTLIRQMPMSDLLEIAVQAVARAQSRQ